MSDHPAAPVNPALDDWQWNEQRLEAEGFATGLDVWDQVSKAYENYLRDGDMANAQLWSLREAIRAQLRAEQE